MSPPRRGGADPKANSIGKGQNAKGKSKDRPLLAASLVGVGKPAWVSTLEEMWRKARLPALRLFHRAVIWAARPMRIRIIKFLAWQEPAPLEKPQSLP
jgi:hypothetical protein